MRGVLKCVEMGSGVQFVMTSGTTVMQVLSVHNWATKDKVYNVLCC